MKVFLLSAFVVIATASAACGPDGCEGDDCHPKCPTRCQELGCSKCQIKCSKPECEVRCPVKHCEKGRCPECETVCRDPKCHTECTNPPPKCESVCEEPVCDWKCHRPDNCPKPKCALVCEKSPHCQEPPAPQPCPVGVIVAGCVSVVPTSASGVVRQVVGGNVQVAQTS